MSNLRKAAEALVKHWEAGEFQNCTGDMAGHIRLLRQALAQPVDAVNMSQERVDETAKGKREWVGLTDEEIIKCFDSVAFGQVEGDLIINKHVNIFTAIRSIEAKLKEKNT